MIMEYPTRAPKDLDKDATKALTADLLEKLRELQNTLYAQRKYSVLVVLQGMDASGKDGLIKKVFSGVNPMGCSVCSFKAPTEVELAHDFLWRIHQSVPARGMIQIFNRSHYEDVLITRVNKWIDDDTAQERFNHINHFESLLVSNNTVVLKFFLNVSKEEQKKRFQERIDDPAKRWKYNANDWKVNDQYDDYLRYYREVIESCNEPGWTVVPADQNWYKEHVVAKTIVDALKKLPLEYPEPAATR
jgi:PPK2 family polyphosphate:nucleotide phosphotransferase